MKLLVAFLAGVFAVASVASEAPAAEKRTQYRAAKQKPVTASRYRSSTTQANGLCQRDTGKPTSELSFRDKCDMEEFWNRMDRGGGFGRR